MKILLLVDVYPPSRISAAVQMRDLAVELLKQGHQPAVIVPDCRIRGAYSLGMEDGVEVLRVWAPAIKDVGLVRRAFGECVLSFAMLRGLSRSPWASRKWDGIVWYSPTIFFGPMVRRLKQKHRCRTYLILRDIFPDWAVDAGILRKGVAYAFFKCVEKYQYSVADVIGVQTRANLGYLESWATCPGRRLEVLNNWLSKSPVKDGISFIKDSVFSDKKLIFVYAGNMGVAQGMDCLVDLADALQDREVGFLFVGRGSDVPRLKEEITKRSIQNVVFHDEIEPWEVPGLLAQCHVGLLALDPRLKTHSIPGKLLTYLYAGLPVLARVNAGNDLESLISAEGVGKVCIGDSRHQLYELAIQLIDNAQERAAMGARGRRLAERIFSVSAAAEQLVARLQGA